MLEISFYLFPLLPSNGLDELLLISFSSHLDCSPPPQAMICPLDSNQSHFLSLRTTLTFIPFCFSL